jgi:hypothetical protein
MEGLPSNVSVDANEDEGYAEVVVRVPPPGPFTYRVRPARTGGGFVISDPLHGKVLTATTFEQACETAASLATALSERAAEEAAADSA